MFSRVVDDIDKVSLFDPRTEDASTVAAANSGDTQAFEILVGRHQRRILALALHFTRVREDTEDVVQQSFQRAFAHLNKFAGKSSWLTHIAMNEALMLLRRNRALRFEKYSHTKLRMKRKAWKSWNGKQMRLKRHLAQFFCIWHRHEQEIQVYLAQ